MFKKYPKIKPFCTWCGANLIDHRRGWFMIQLSEKWWWLISPLYTWHLFRCARPHGISWWYLGYDANSVIKK